MDYNFFFKKAAYRSDQTPIAKVETCSLCPRGPNDCNEKWPEHIFAILPFRVFFAGYLKGGFSSSPPPPPPPQIHYEKSVWY